MTWGRSAHVGRLKRAERRATTVVVAQASKFLRIYSAVSLSRSIFLQGLDLPTAQLFPLGNKSVRFRENHAVCSQNDGFHQCGKEEGQQKDAT